jgi:hypothetical protein
MLDTMRLEGHTALVPLPQKVCLRRLIPDLEEGIAAARTAANDKEHSSGV